MWRANYRKRKRDAWVAVDRGKPATGSPFFNDKHNDPVAISVLRRVFTEHQYSSRHTECSRISREIFFITRNQRFTLAPCNLAWSRRQVRSISLDSENNS